MLTVTHLLDPVPTEIHVFASLASHLPIMVATTNGAFWLVNGATTTRVEDRGPASRVSSGAPPHR